MPVVCVSRWQKIVDVRKRKRKLAERKNRKWQTGNICLHKGLFVAAERPVASSTR
jgi:hypothetical protein